MANYISIKYEGGKILIETDYWNEGSGNEEKSIKLPIPPEILARFPWFRRQFSFSPEDVLELLQNMNFNPGSEYRPVTFSSRVKNLLAEAYRILGDGAHNMAKQLLARGRALQAAKHYEAAQENLQTFLILTSGKAKGMQKPTLFLEEPQNFLTLPSQNRPDEKAA